MCRSVREVKKKKKKMLYQNFFERTKRVVYSENLG